MTYLLSLIIIIAGLTGTIVIGSFVWILVINLFESIIEHQQAKERERKCTKQ